MNRDDYAKAVEAEKNRLGLVSNAEVARSMGIHPSTLSKGLSGEMPIGNKHLRGLETIQAKNSAELREEITHYGSRPPTYVETTTPDGRPLKIPVAAEVGGLEAAVRAARGGTIPGHKMADYLERLAQRSAVPMTPELEHLLSEIRQQPEIAI